MSRRTKEMMCRGLDPAYARAHANIAWTVVCAAFLESSAVRPLDDARREIEIALDLFGIIPTNKTTASGHPPTRTTIISGQDSHSLKWSIGHLLRRNVGRTAKQAGMVVSVGVARSAKSSAARGQSDAIGLSQKYPTKMKGVWMSPRPNSTIDVALASVVILARNVLAGVVRHERRRHKAYYRASGDVDGNRVAGVIGRE